MSDIICQCYSGKSSSILLPILFYQLIRNIIYVVASLEVKIKRMTSGTIF